MTHCAGSGLSDQEIADIVGWDTKFVGQIKRRYVDQAKVAASIAECLLKGEV